MIEKEDMVLLGEKKATVARRTCLLRSTTAIWRLIELWGFL